jgi:hypothetical protein
MFVDTSLFVQSYDKTSNGSNTVVNISTAHWTTMKYLGARCVDTLHPNGPHEPRLLQGPCTTGRWLW